MTDTEKKQLEYKSIIAYIITQLDDDNYMRVQDELVILSYKIDRLIDEVSYDTQG